MARKTIRIPMIVDAAGKWAMSGSSALEKSGPDWDWIDEMADHENLLANPQRYWVTVEIDLPETKEVAGIAVAEKSE